MEKTSERLEAMGVKITYGEEVESRSRYMHTREGDRILVGPFMSGAELNKELEDSRLTAELNIDPGEVETAAELPEDHPLYAIRLAALRLILMSIDFATREVKDQDVDNIKRCLSMNVNVAVSPGYINLEVIGIMYGNLLAMIFGPGIRPIVTVTGVVANPRGSLMTISAEYIAAD
ncbi:MAG: hypothetical protein AAF429_13310 [Pseudomonadota bacterium]